MKQQLVKQNAMRNMTLLIEVAGCLFLILLMSWSTTVGSPIVIADIYAGCLRGLSLFRFSTHSVFIIGNLIIIVVVVQSGKLSEKTPTHKVQFVHFADEKIQNSRPRLRSALDAGEFPGTRARETQVGFEAPFLKHGIDSVPQVRSAPIAGDITIKLPSSKTLNLNPSVSENEEPFVKQSVAIVPEESEQVNAMPESSNQVTYRRTLSASYERGARVNRRVGPELVRSKTVKCGTGEGVAGTFDELNHDEFRRKIESFIAKQRRLIREELVAGDDAFR